MIKFTFAAFISILPTCLLRRALYRLVLKYRIPSSSQVGWLTIIAVANFQVGEKVRIGMFNFFKGPIDVKIGDRSRIGRKNKFTCSMHITQERFASRNYTPRLILGTETLVLNEHFFDVYGEVLIDDGSWIAGHGSQFWTHGLSVMDRDIRIGKKNYIGSASRFAPGASLGSENIVALGSVILSKLDCNQSLVSGFPAKPVRSISDDLENGKYRFSFQDW